MPSRGSEDRSGPEQAPDDGAGADATNGLGSEAALDAAIDDALAELHGTVGHDAAGRDGAGRPVAASPSAAAGDASEVLGSGPDGHAADGSGDPTQTERRRRSRAGLRTAVQTLTARMVSERAVQAAAAASASAEAAQAAVEQGRGRDRPSPFQWGFFGGLGVLIAYITFLVLDSIRDTLVMIAIATLLAIGLDPLVSAMTKRGLRRGAGVAVVFLGLLLVIAAAIYAIIPPIINEVGSFVATVPTLINDLQTNDTVQGLDQRFGLLEALRNSNIVQSLGSGAAGGILSASFTVATVFADLLIVLILTLYFLAGFPRIKAAGYRLVPASRRVRVSDLGDRILKQMGGYLSGATIIAIQAGLVAGIFSSIIGLPYPWAIGLGAAVLDFIPVVGPIIVGVSITLIGFTQGLGIGIISGVFYLCQHLFEAYWLYPRVMRRTVNISTGGVVVAILIGASLLGVTGAILAVPVAAAIMLIVREVIMPMQERS
ncbi:MAG TPA: AI-2E family transporter [Nakamurella multipartita]|jgi:predicted PurR-regulated permease PerM|nr:AI-2E family transporter [Nakamurella multipartita]